MRPNNRTTVARLSALALTIALEIAASGIASGQTPELPFDVGERLRYRVTVGKIGVGEGEMSVSGPVAIRGTETLVLRSELHAKLGFLKSSQVAASWIDPTRMATLRYEKRARGAFVHDEEQEVELYPEDRRWEDERGREGHSPTSAPLDELSFIYYLRTLPLDADTADHLVRHYDPARNPVVVRVLGRDTLRTSAGTFATIIVEMRVRDARRYGGEGVIRLYLSDDANRLPVRIESAVPVLGSTVLTLESYTRSTQHLAASPPK